MRVHIEGMGMLGAMLAWRLDAEGVPFTWHDTGARISAWPASTGSIVPTGDKLEAQAYDRWLRIYSNAVARVAWGDVMERGAYWYNNKNAPHGSKHAAAKDLGALRLHPLPSLHLNVQSFVLNTRNHFAPAQISARHGAPGGARVVQAHGYTTARLGRYSWGWSVPVTCDVSMRLIMASALRPCAYIKDGRYVMAYIYPRPGTATWYLGSSMQAQALGKARELETASKIDKAVALIHRETKGMITNIKPAGDVAQGWRPIDIAANDSLAYPWQDRIIVKPCGSAGVRLAPLVADAVLELLQ